MRLLIKSIQEEKNEAKTVVEEAPRKVKGSNGVVERAVQEIEGIIRAILLSMEERLGRDIDAKDRIVALYPHMQPICTIDCTEQRMVKWLMRESK
eukprot:345118-Karenia_brevis.AAC.1